MKGLFYGGSGASQLLAQAIDLVVGFIWAWGITYLIFIVVKRFIVFRVSPEVEIIGLDEAEFGQVCYPDFQLVTELDSGITDELDVTTDSPRSIT